MQAWLPSYATSLHFMLKFSLTGSSKVLTTALQAALASGTLPVASASKTALASCATVDSIIAAVPSAGRRRCTPVQSPGQTAAAAPVTVHTDTQTDVEGQQQQQADAVGLIDIAEVHVSIWSCSRLRKPSWLCEAPLWRLGVFWRYPIATRLDACRNTGRTQLLFEPACKCRAWWKVWTWLEWTSIFCRICLLTVCFRPRRIHWRRLFDKPCAKGDEKIQ